MALNGGRKLGGSAAMYGSALKDEPSAAELEAAQLGFLQMLRRKRFSGRFIETNAEDLLARARFEYTRAVRGGSEIHSPAGWLINCAWRRTQNLLESQSSEPSFVSTEKAGAIVDEAQPTPEQAAIDSDRSRAIEEAMAHLSHDQKTLIELSYFEGMPVREAARFLGWHASKAQRCHEAALRKLKDALGVADVDALGIEIGLAAWVSLAGSGSVGVSVPGGVEAAADAGGRAAVGFWQRANEAARRVLLGGVGEPTSAAAAGNVARAAGVCGAAAVACLAGGVVGPGVGVDMLASKDRAAPVERSVEEVPAPVQAEAPVPVVVPVQTGGDAGGEGVEVAAAGAPEAEASPQAETPEESAEAEFGAFGESAAPSASSASAPAEVPTIRGPEGESGSGGGNSSASSGAADREFGAFK